jgi:hypothetical protein
MDPGADRPVEDVLAGGATATDFQSTAHGISRSAALGAIRLLQDCHLSPDGGRRGRRKERGKRNTAQNRYARKAVAS